VIPVFRTIEPGGKSLVQIIRMPSAPKSDLIEVVAAPVRYTKQIFLNKKINIFR